MVTPHLNNDILQLHEPLLGEQDSLWNIRDLFGYTVRAKDGEAGKVHDFYFDDKSWAIRYLVVDLGDWALDTGQWIPGQKVVVPAMVCGQPLRETQVLPLTLPQEQVKLSPTLEIYKKWSDKPSSCSVREVTGNYIQALDGDMGHVEGFIIDSKTWVISSIMVDTKNWWPAKKVLISPLWVDRVNVISSTVFVDLPQDFIKNSPEFKRKAFSNN